MRSKKGHVTSTKMEKTAVITVQRHRVHPKYKKYYRITSKYMADSRDVPVNEGDYVEIVETKPISKNKCWKVSKIITKGPGSLDQDAVLRAESEIRHEKELEEKKAEAEAEAKAKAEETKEEESNEESK